MDCLGLMEITTSLKERFFLGKKTGVAAEVGTTLSPVSISKPPSRVDRPLSRVIQALTFHSATMNRHELMVLLVALALAGADDDGYSYPPPGSIIRQEPIIQKHIYVHVPPPDPEFHASAHRVIAPPPPMKHYKIVFIKAPTYSPPTVPPLPEFQQNEEKTLIYVLHKNPQEAPPIVIPTIKPTQPSKPEVYFIRYKTQKEVNYAPSPSPSLHDDGPSGFHIGSTVGPQFVSSTPVYHTTIGKRKIH